MTSPNPHPSNSIARRKPTEPGEYFVCQHKKDGGFKYKVVVTRRGKGLSVFFPWFNDTVPMSLLRENEFKLWERIK